MASGSQDTTAPRSHRVGENWSGANPVPTVQKFIEHLDREKKERDRRIDGENRAKNQRSQQEKAEGRNGEQNGEKNGEAVSHQPREVSQAKVRTVTDPTTGRDIGVEDQDESSMEAVKDPKVCGGPSFYTLILD